MLANYRMYKILISFLILFSSTVFGADIDNELLKKNLDAANTQIEVLKAQVEVMKSYQDNFLSTVYWSLGGVVSIVFILVGYSWLTNFKNQEKEIQLLKDLISKEVLLAKQNLVKEIDDSKKESFEKLLGSLNEETKKTIRPIELKVRDLFKNVNSNNYSLLIIDYEKWMEKKVYGNAVITSLDLIKISLAIGIDYYIEESLEKLIQVLERGLNEKDKATIDVNAIKKISEVLSKLDNHHDSIKLKIQSLINKLNSLE